MNSVELAYSLSSLFMFGLIWFVQIIHYPLFKRVSPDSFSAFHREHTRLAGFLIAPVMLIEAGSISYLYFLATLSHSLSNLHWHFFLTLGVWISTFCIQVPLHHRLEREGKQKTIEFLINSNWIRTIFWTVKAVLVSIDISC